MDSNLTGPGYAFRFTAPCEECASDTVVARIPFSMLRSMSAATVVDLEALGFSVRLSAADRAALHAFVDTVVEGVVIRGADGDAIAGARRTE